MASPVADERTGAARRAGIPIPHREWCDFEIKRAGEDSRETAHREIAVFEAGRAARHVKFTEHANGRRSIDYLVKTLHPCIAGAGHTCLNEFLGRPWQDKMNCAAARDHRFEKKNV